MSFQFISFLLTVLNIAVQIGPPIIVFGCCLALAVRTRTKESMLLLTGSGIVCTVTVARHVVLYLQLVPLNEGLFLAAAGLIYLGQLFFAVGFVMLIRSMKNSSWEEDERAGL